MYKGRRDDHINLRVPQENCFKYTAQTGQKFIEIKLPGFTNDEWYSFMVDTSQVFYDYEEPDRFNIIEDLNRDTKIKVSKKLAANNNSGRVMVADSEFEADPLLLIAYFIDANKANRNLSRVVGLFMTPKTENTEESEETDSE